MRDMVRNGSNQASFIWYLADNSVTKLSTSLDGADKHIEIHSFIDIIKLFSPEDQKTLKNQLDKIGEKPSERLDFDGYMADNRTYAYLSLSEVFEGNKRFIQIFYTNDSYNIGLYHEIVEQSKDILSLHYPDGTVFYVSPSVKEILGYKPDELIGANFYQDLSHSEDLSKSEIDSRNKSTQAEFENGIEHRLLHKEGYHVWLESYTSPVYNDAGAVEKLVVSSRDITEKKALELLLEETGRLASVGGWQYFPKNDKLELTSETYRIHEIPVGSEVDVSLAVSYAHPDYKDLIREKINNLINYGEPYNVEAKIITANQKEKWVRIKGRAEFLDQAPSKVMGSFQDITDRKLTENELKTTENRAQQLTENAFDLIFWLDTQGFFTYLNPKALQVTGYEEDEIIDQHFAQVVAEQHYESTAERFAELINKKADNVYLQIQIVNKEGLRYWLGINVQSIQANGEIQEVVGIARDITEQVEAEQALKATTSQLYALIENLQAGILVESEQRELIFTNQYFADMFQLPYSPSEMKGFDCEALLQNAKGDFENPDNFEATVQYIVKTREYRIGEEWKLNDGRTLERDHVPIYQGQHFLGHLWHYNDITERKQTEQELIESKEKAEKASRAQADFLSTMSHEIRTPLNAVIGLSDVLLQQNPREEQVENLKVLKFSGENLLNLINDILDFNKIEAGKIEINEEPFNLNELIKGLQKTHTFKAEEKGLKLKYLADSNIPDYLLGDKTRISQVLNNLISNALKFTHEGSVTIETEKLLETESDATVYFAVVDTGIGIPEDKLNTVFNSFTQAHSSTNGQYGGTGLGLSITKRLLNLMNSDIKAQSEAHAGTRFEFTITFPKPDDQSLEQLTANVEIYPNQKQLDKKRVLLVEDNQMNVFMAKQILENWGMEVIVSYDGPAAVEQVKTSHFDIILMDLQMPEMNGYEATRKIREIGGTESIPIIALTASALMEVEWEVYNAGMNEYVTKPFNPDDLYNKILKTMNKTQ